MVTLNVVPSDECKYVETGVFVYCTMDTISPIPPPTMFLGL